MVSSQFGQLLELGGIFVEFSSFHLEFKELLFRPVPAHDILEILGKVIDHCVPDPFIGVSSPSPKMLVQLSGYLLYPKVHLWASEILEEQHRSLHGVVHCPGVFVDPLVDAPAGHEFFNFVPISFEDLRFPSYQFI